MKFSPLLLALFAFAPLMPLASQEEGSLDWDINSVFDEPAPRELTGEANDETEPPAGASPPAAPAVASLLRRRGLTFTAAYEFIAGLAPGWNEAPWFSPEGEDFLWGQSMKMLATYTLDAQISKDFRVRNVVYFKIPNFKFTLGNFFFDYTLYDSVFVRGGKYSYSWGISPNFRFANLLARVPADGYKGESFILRADAPVGIGGIQLLTITRAPLMNGTVPGWHHIGFGGKYNLALRWIDLDIGALYQKNMPFRAFLSVKTTIKDTELYTEWLGADINKPELFSGAANLGISQDFFAGKLSVNAEIFYNTEGDAFWYDPETSIRDAEISPYNKGLNGALNLVYRFGGKLNPRAFIQSHYAYEENSANLVPGFRLSPWANAELYFAVPMALGSKEGYYYSHSIDPRNRPFCIMMLFTLKGSVRAGYNY